MRRSLVPLLAAVALASPAGAKPIGCVVVLDPDRDVLLPGGAKVAEAQEHLQHLDVLWGTVENAGRDLVVRLYVRSTRAVTEQGARGVWAMSFTTRDTRALVTVTAEGAGAALAYRAGVDGAELVPVTGSATGYNLTARVPYAVLGAAAPRRGDVLTDFRMEAYDRLPAGDLAFRDAPDHVRRGTYGVPGRCRYIEGPGA